MYQDGTRVVLPDGREGVIEVSSEDDWAYHVRLDSGEVVQVPENWIEPIDRLFRITVLIEALRRAPNSQHVPQWSREIQQLYTTLSPDDQAEVSEQLQELNQCTA